MPVRKVPRSHRNLTGLHASPTGSRPIAFESSLERDFITLMLFDPEVEDVEEQPVSVPLPTGRTYTPDFLVTFRSRSRLLAEVKPIAALQSDADRLEPKFSAARSFARAKGWRFEVWTEESIRVPRLSNAKFLLPFRKRTPALPDIGAILASPHLASGADHVIRAAFTSEMDRARGLAALWHLVAAGRLVVDLDSPLAANTPLHLAPGEGHVR